MKKIKTQAISLNHETDDPLACLKKRFNDSGFVVAYMDFKVFIGRHLEHRCIFAGNETLDANNLKYLRRLRVFNDRQEVLIWRTEDNNGDKVNFNGRLRIDDEGKEKHNIFVDV